MKLPKWRCQTHDDTKSTNGRRMRKGTATVTRTLLQTKNSHATQCMRQRSGCVHPIRWPVTDKDPCAATFQSMHNVRKPRPRSKKFKNIRRSNKTSIHAVRRLRGHAAVSRRGLSKKLLRVAHRTWVGASSLNIQCYEAKRTQSGRYCRFHRRSSSGCRSGEQALGLNAAPHAIYDRKANA